MLAFDVPRMQVLGQTVTLAAKAYNYSYLRAIVCS
jgi:hypothetical protein